MDTKAEYRTLVQNMGKKEFTFLKMQEYGFWPSNLPTPYERQQNETRYPRIFRVFSPYTLLSFCKP